MLLALLRKARAACATSIRAELEAAGFDDLPGNGVYVLASLARSSAPFSRIIGDLSVSKQAAGQLIDTLVQRGYLAREPDAQDRRRLNLSLGERGRIAAGVALSAAARIDRALAARVGEDCVRQAERALAALIAASAPEQPDLADGEPEDVTAMENPVAGFGLAALHRALDEARCARRLSWTALADEINAPFAHTGSIPIHVATIRGIAGPRSVTSAVVLQILRWLDRSPESFMSATARRFGPEEKLPEPGPRRILRFDTRQLHAALDLERRDRRLAWAQVAADLPGITPGMLTNLATGPLIGFPRVMAMTQWLGRPAAAFVRGRER